jgi:hypothetical protein
MKLYFIKFIRMMGFEREEKEMRPMGAFPTGVIAA